jgi:hypothetical protein
MEAMTKRRPNQHRCRVTRTRTVAACVSALALLVAPSASAHPNHQGERAVVERVTPSLDGVEVHGLADGFGKIALSTSGSTSAVVLSDSGQPILRVGPKGVEANQASPDWYRVNEPLGIAQVPPTATPKAPDSWVRISTLRSWEWFDHRIHPAGPKKIKQWSIPIEADGKKATIKGRSSPPPGVLDFRLQDKQPAPKVTVSTINVPNPALRIRNDGDKPVDVLGPDGEVFARISSSGAQINVHSPGWIPTAQYQNRIAELMTDVIDPKLKPKFVGAGPAAEFVWPEPAMVPKSALPALTGTTRLRAQGDIAKWSVPLRVEGSTKPIAIKGTTFIGKTPPAETPDAGPGDNTNTTNNAAATTDSGPSGVLIGLIIAASLAVVVAVFLVGRKGREAPEGSD